MKRKISSVLAAVLVGSMIIGTTVFAADSSTTTNTQTTSLLEQDAVKAGETLYAAPNGKNQGVATCDGKRVTVDYSGVTTPGAVETLVKLPENEEATKVLRDYVNANLNGATVVFGGKFRVYKAGVSLTSGFGSAKQAVGVGNQYDGRTAVVTMINQDGTITTLEVPVVNGKVNFEITGPVSVMIAIR